MNGRHEPLETGFHEGELAVQRRAGVAAEAARLSGMVAPGELRGGLVRFLAERTFAALAAHDRAGRLWVSPLAGPPGFLAAVAPTTLDVLAAPRPGDPLIDLEAGQPAALLVVEFATRRRVRINGTLAATGPDRLRIEVEQAYGNCPQYIHPRLLAPVSPSAAAPAVRRGHRLAAADIELIRAADTFVVGTQHPTRGVDSSHRGGRAGFVRVEDGTQLWWPDYLGNNMFNTLGNLAVDPTAALLVPDFATGRTVQLTGTAAVEWAAPGADGDVDTGRRVHFTVAEVVSGSLLPVRSDDA